jgi:hypothetical protein
VGFDAAVVVQSTGSSVVVVAAHLSIGSQHMKLRPLHL